MIIGLGITGYLVVGFIVSMLCSKYVFSYEAVGFVYTDSELKARLVFAFFFWPFVLAPGIIIALAYGLNFLFVDNLIGAFILWCSDKVWRK